MLTIVGVLFLIFIISIILLTIIFLILREKSRRIFGIYPRKGIFYHLKYLLALQGIKYSRDNIILNKNKDSDYLKRIDGPQVLSHNPKAYDKVYFVGSNLHGYRFCVSMERRHKGIFNTAIYLWIPNQGLFLSEKLPDMMHFVSDDGKCVENFICDGLQIYTIEAMKKWKITFNGNLLECSTKILHSVNIDCEFISKDQQYFNYNTDLSHCVLADSLARESWNDDFFHLAKTLDDIVKDRDHYEQIGNINGTIKIDNDNLINLDMQAMRDHSFGSERDLSSIHRYVYIILFLRNGSTVVIGHLSQPSFFLSSLKVGYVYTKDGRYHPIKYCNFELFSYGEKGKPPKHKNFYFDTDDKQYLVQIVAESQTKRYAGMEWESKIYTQFVTCAVNGVTGYGIADYLYQNKTGRPINLSNCDPDWYNRIKSFERSLSAGEIQYEDDDDYEF